jgi:hypothetical protein
MGLAPLADECGSTPVKIQAQLAAFLQRQDGITLCKLFRIQKIGKKITMTTSNLLRIRESNLECVDATGTLRWSVPVGSILLVSEYTTNEGPYIDDYFLVFVTAEDGKLYFSTCSFYSVGVEEALSMLQEYLGSAIQLGLQGSTEWRSRVAWPAKMAESEYFTFTPVPAETLIEKLKKRLLGPTHDFVISKVVQEYLKEQIRSRSL